MTAVTAPSRRSATGGSAVRTLRKAGARMLGLLAPARPVMKNLASYPLTVAMCAAADMGGFAVWHRAGWFVLAASLGYLEHVLADE